MPIYAASISKLSELASQLRQKVAAHGTDIIGIDLQNVPAHQRSKMQFKAGTHTAGKMPQRRLDLRIANHERFHIAEQEPVGGCRLGEYVQKQPEIVQRFSLVNRNLQQALRVHLKL